MRKEALSMQFTDRCLAVCHILGGRYGWQPDPKATLEDLVVSADHVETTTITPCALRSSRRANY
jgi:hypothetical protein